MSGGGYPPDHSVELEQMKSDEAKQAQAAADLKQKQEDAKLSHLRDVAMRSGRTSAVNYFNTQGVDPSQYMSTIGDLINQISSTVPQDSQNPGSYYKDVGATAFDTAQTAARTKAESGLDRLFSPNFEYTRLPDTADDPTISAIDAEQRQTAEQFLNNLKARGVITDTGFASGEKDLDRQNAGVMARLNELGQGTLETGRQGLRDIVNRGRQSADTLRLGTNFDPNSYGSQVDQSFSDFLTHLGDTLRGKVGNSNLFDTSGLPAIAGAAQGAGNTQYDPKALAGLFSEDDTNKDNTNNNRVTGATGVF